MARIGKLEAEREQSDQQRIKDQNDLFALQEELYAWKKDAAERIDQLRKSVADNAHLRGLLHSENFAGPDQMVVRPNYQIHNLGLLHNHAFLIMPFSPEWSKDVDKAVRKAMLSSGMICHRADELTGRNILVDIWKSLCEYGTIITDITDCNPNVMYELGLADALGKNVILIAQTSNPQWIAFDLLGQRLIVYSLAELTKLTNDLLSCMSDRTAKQQSVKAAHTNG